MKLRVDRRIGDDGKIGMATTQMFETVLSIFYPKLDLLGGLMGFHPMGQV